MKENKVMIMSMILFVMIIGCTERIDFVLLPGGFLILFVFQTILTVLQFCDVVYRWKEYKKAEKDEFCEYLSYSRVYNEKIQYIPFVLALGVRIVQFGINPKRAGPTFLVS